MRRMGERKKEKTPRSPAAPCSTLPPASAREQATKEGL